MSENGKYPECEKLASVSDQSQTIGEFLDWLGTMGYHIADDMPYMLNRTIEEWLALYFDIDMDKVEDERRQILEELGN